jgi:ankyrin repeat protein
MDLINLDLDNYYIKDYKKFKLSNDDRNNIINGLLKTNIDMILDLILNKINHRKPKKSLTKSDFLYFDDLFKNSKDIINNRTKEGDTLLHSMVFFNCYDLVYLLIKNGAKLDMEDLDKQIPLHRTIFLSDDKILKLLLKKSNNINNDLNYKDKDGNTPLHLAVLIKNYNIINILLKYGADPYIMNNAEIIPLDLAKDNTKDFDLRIIQIFKKYICE